MSKLAIKLPKELGCSVDVALGTYSYLCQHKELVDNDDIWKTVEERIRKYNCEGLL